MTTTSDITRWIRDYLANQCDALAGLPTAAIADLIRLADETAAEKRTIFLIGNGGNAANCSHFATDLGKGASDRRSKRIRVLSLTDNMPWLTALGNDYSYDDVFVRQLQNYAEHGDMLLASSVSGNSPNLVKAVEWGNANGLNTIALVGEQRGQLASLARHVLVIGDTHYGRVEDVQMSILHIVANALMETEIPTDCDSVTLGEATRFVGMVEIAPQFVPRAGINHVLFDFDGTLSLIRQGWPDVMVPMFVEMLPVRDGESEADLADLAMNDIMRLNGKQTIYQMIQLAERIAERGGTPRDPLWYKHEYLRRLNERIRVRIEALREKRITSDDLLVHGARALLANLCSRGLTLHLASGTDEPYVKEEAELLGLTQYFEGRIFGALDDYENFSKQMVIERILREHTISGDRLLSFGDGYVEIENTKQVGGLAVAVASDEANNGLGQVDPWKRQRLLGVGADVVIPDYRDAIALMQVITAS